MAQRDDFMVPARDHQALAELPTRACEQDFQPSASLTDGIRLICSLSVTGGSVFRGEER